MKALSKEYGKLYQVVLTRDADEAKKKRKSLNSQMKLLYDNYKNSLDKAALVRDNYKSSYDKLKKENKKADSTVTDEDVQQAKYLLDAANTDLASVKSSFLLDINAKITELDNGAKAAETEKKGYSIQLDSLAVFLNLMNDFTKERAEIEDWLSLISDYMELETLDRATVTGLIERITVSERGKTNDKHEQELEIEYRFIGSLPQSSKKDIA